MTALPHQPRPEYCHIVAASSNGVIGRAGGLPWHIPEDMRYFRESTRNHILIMGRKTWDSLGHPLPQRFNMVVTRNVEQLKNPPDLAVTSLAAAFEAVPSLLGKWPERVFIIGGGEIYRETLDQVNQIFLTRVHEEVAGDTYYPVLDPQRFQLTREIHRPGNPAYSFCTYQKLNR